MKITITASPAEDLIDPENPEQLSAEANDELMDTLMEHGYDNIEVSKVGG